MLEYEFDVPTIARARKVLDYATRLYEAMLAAEMTLLGGSPGEYQDAVVELEWARVDARMLEIPPIELERIENVAMVHASKVHNAGTGFFDMDNVLHENQAERKQLGL